MIRWLTALLFVICLSVAKHHAIANDPGASQSSEKPVRWMFVLCGLPGDDEHRERMTTACKQLIVTSMKTFQVEQRRLFVLAGDQEMCDALQSSHPSIEVCTRESSAQLFESLQKRIEPDHECWGMMIGHAHLEDKQTFFNVKGKDFEQLEFASWVQPLRAKRQVFFVMTPASGFWIKPLAQSGRIVISATEPAREVTGTEMPYAMADILAGDGEQAIKDIDGDDSITLLDLYLAVNIEVNNRFRTMERLVTEHAQLDDNGDGRGSELQEAYLSVLIENTSDDESKNASTDKNENATAEGASEATAPPAASSAKRPPVIDRQSMDGYQSRQVRLRG